MHAKRYRTIREAKHQYLVGQVQLYPAKIVAINGNCEFRQLCKLFGA